MLTVVSGTPTGRRPQLAAAYDRFRLDRQPNLVSPRTLAYYDGMLQPFFAWLLALGEVTRFGELDSDAVRRYRVFLAERTTRVGRQSRP